MTAPASADWTFHWATPRPQGDALFGVSFETATSGLAVGDYGTVLSTTDGGATWSDISDDAFTTTLQDVLGLGSGDYLAVGEDPGIFRSTNGGLSWSSVPNPGSGTLRKIDAVAPSILSVTGEAGQVLRSTDAGSTWTSTNTATAQSITGQDWRTPLHGRVVGFATAFETTDGGNAWVPISDILGVAFRDGFTDIAFVDDAIGYAFAHFATWKTTDSGATWAQITRISDPVYQDEAIVFDGARRLIGIRTEGAGIFETTDDGVTWTTRWESRGLEGTAALRPIPGGFFSVSTGADLLKSTDGADWQNALSWPRSTGERVFYEAVEVTPDGNRAFSGGSPAAIFSDGPIWVQSTDGGTNWFEPVAAPDIELLRAIRFFDADLGLAGGKSNPADHIFRTTNGGASWVAKPLNVTGPGGVWVLDIEFPTASVAFALTTADNQYRVVRSTDAGGNWSQVGNILANGVRWNAISFTSASDGWVAGGDFNLRMLHHTTDGGLTWNDPLPLGLPSDEVKTMVWPSETVGWLGFDSFPDGIWRTTDAGATWSQVDGVATRFLSAANEQFGVASSSSPQTVRVTSDAGATWTTVPLPTRNYVGAVCATQRGFLVVGESNTILEAIDSNATPVTPPVRIAANGIGLTASPTVGERFSVSFALERAGAARLEIFDVRGRRVAVLADGIFAASETVTRGWPGGGSAASGVYFARVSAGTQRTAIRLVRVH